MVCAFEVLKVGRDIFKRFSRLWSAAMQLTSHSRNIPASTTEESNRQVRNNIALQNLIEPIAIITCVKHCFD